MKSSIKLPPILDQIERAGQTGKHIWSVRVFIDGNAVPTEFNSFGSLVRGIPRAAEVRMHDHILERLGSLYARSQLETCRIELVPLET